MTLREKTIHFLEKKHNLNLKGVNDEELYNVLKYLKLEGFAFLLKEVKNYEK